MGKDNIFELLTHIQLPDYKMIKHGLQLHQLLNTESLNLDFISRILFLDLLGSICKPERKQLK